MSQLDNKTETIGDHKYTVHYLDPLTANDLLLDIGKAVGPGIGAIIGSIGKDGFANLMDKQIDGAMLADGVRQLCQGMDQAKFRQMIDTLAQVTIVDGKGKLSDVMLTHFQGKIGLMYRWIAFALKVQFADFFDSGKKAIAGNGLLGQILSESQST